MFPAGSAFSLQARRTKPVAPVRHTLAVWALLLVVGSLAGGCSSVNEINVGAPRPAELDTTAAETPRASFTIDLHAGMEAFPEGIQSTRFRIREIWMKARDGEWTKRQAETEPFRVDGSGTITRTLLATEVAAAVYDSLALFFDDIYIEYGPTAGGVPTLRGTTPLTLPAPFTLENGRHTVLRLEYTAPASITQDTTSCLWTFAPVVTFGEAAVQGARTP